MFTLFCKETQVREQSRTLMSRNDDEVTSEYASIVDHTSRPILQKDIISLTNLRNLFYLEIRKTHVSSGTVSFPKVHHHEKKTRLVVNFE